MDGRSSMHTVGVKKYIWWNEWLKRNGFVGIGNVLLHARWYGAECKNIPVFKQPVQTSGCAASLDLTHSLSTIQWWSGLHIKICTSFKWLQRWFFLMILVEPYVVFSQAGRAGCVQAEHMWAGPWKPLRDHDIALGTKASCFKDSGNKKYKGLRVCNWVVKKVKQLLLAMDFNKRGYSSGLPWNFLKETLVDPLDQRRQIKLLSCQGTYSYFYPLLATQAYWVNWIWRTFYSTIFMVSPKQISQFPGYSWWSKRSKIFTSGQNSHKPLFLGSAPATRSGGRCFCGWLSQDSLSLSMSNACQTKQQQLPCQPLAKQYCLLESYYC